MSDLLTKIISLLSAIIVAITGFFGSIGKKDDTKPADPVTTTVATQKPTTQKPTTTTKAPGTTKKPTTTTTTRKASASDGTLYSDSAFLHEAENALNNVRMRNGLPLLKADSNLAKVAAVRAKEIKMSFTHTRPDGRKYSTVFDELKIAKPVSMTESIARALIFYDAADIIKTLSEEPNRQPGIFNAKYKRFGLAWYVDDSEYTDRIRDYVVLILAE